MQRLSATALLSWFVFLAISPLWGAHVHHTETTEAGCVDAISIHLSKQNDRLQSSAIAKAHKDRLFRQAHYAVYCEKISLPKHCRFEPLLNHLLENAIWSKSKRGTDDLHFIASSSESLLPEGRLAPPIAFEFYIFPGETNRINRQGPAPGLARSPPFLS